MEFHLDEGIPILERTPRVLRDLLTDLSPGWIRSNEGGESWIAMTRRATGDEAGGLGAAIIGGAERRPIPEKEDRE